MGVPAFYRWISEKYSKIVVDMLEKRPNVIEGIVIPMNLLEPNPNSIEYDNLYVDMNGLIHPCSHPEDREAPKTEAEMYINVTKYLDRLVAAVRPRRVLYLAIDGVAPRAKMNQQRSRRFRAAQDVKEKKEMMDEVIAEMVSMGYDAPEAKEGGDWDSNVITPGTEFMINLSAYVRFYVLDRMNRDPFWKGITVVFSDASEPGEGEHKIMSYIRNQRAQPGYDPNQRHILHGLDADLIMLALATHEAHFTILREKVTFGRKKDEPEVSEGQKLLDAQSMRNGILVSCVNPQDEWVYKTPMQALHVNVLREYLDNEFACLKHALAFGYDLERIIDDFIFLCFFVGNDFLPHLPSLDIRDGALDFLMECYKELLPSLGDYITSPGGHLNLRQADVILGRVGEIEDQIFIQRKSAADNEERRRQQRFGGRNTSGNNLATGGARDGGNNRAGSNGASTIAIGGGSAATCAPPSAPPNAPSVPNNVNRPITYGVPGVAAPLDGAPVTVADQNKAAASALKQSLLGKRSAAAVTTPAASEEPAARVARTEESAEAAQDQMQQQQEPLVTDESTAGTEDFDMDDEETAEMETCVVLPAVKIVTKQKAMSPAEIERAKEELKKRIKDKEQALIDKNKETIVDAVKLHETGWKDRYYGEKYKKENVEAGGGLAKMAYSYVQGLCWVLRYYYQGVPSWNWYYPFHYAPFASDLRNIDSYGEIEFELSEPFRPIEQLLAVFPANSVRALPEPCHWLMTDPSSPIYDLYDSDIPIDPNGKHLPWLWILLLPFVDERRIVAAFELCRSKFSLADAKRNKFGLPVVFMHQDHPVAKYACEHLRYTPGAETDREVLRAIKAESAKMDEQFGQGDADGGTSDAMEVSSGSVAAIEQRCEFDAVTGHGMSGVLAPAPPNFYAPLHTIVKAPQDTTFAFLDIAENRALCFTYTLLPMNDIHKSELLPGVVPQQSILNQFDLMHRRPPRLNKGGFNITDIFQSLRDKEQRGNSNYRGASHYDTNPYGNYGHGRQGHQTMAPQQGGRSQYGLQAQLQYTQQDPYGRSQPQYNSYQQPAYQQQQQGYQNQRGGPQGYGDGYSQGYGAPQQGSRYPQQYPPQLYPPQQQYPPQYPAYQQDSRYTPQQGYQQPPAYYQPDANQYPQDPYAAPSQQRRPAAPIEHTVTDLKDRQTQRLTSQYGSHRVDRSVPIGASGRQGSGNTGGGRQAVFLDTIPVQAQPAPAQRYRHSAPGGTTAGARGSSAFAPAQVPPAFRAPPAAPQAAPVRGHSFNPSQRAAPAVPTYQQGAPQGAGPVGTGGADSLQSIRDQLLKTLQQQQQHPH